MGTSLRIITLRNKPWNETVVRMTDLVVTGDVEACHWRPGLSAWRLSVSVKKGSNEHLFGTFEQHFNAVNYVSTPVLNGFESTRTFVLMYSKHRYFGIILRVRAYVFLSSSLPSQKNNMNSLCRTMLRVTAVYDKILSNKVRQFPGNRFP